MTQPIPTIKLAREYKGGSWQHHWRRVLAGRQLIQKLYDGVPTEVTGFLQTVGLQSIVLCFMHDCFNLRDFLRNDPARNLTQAEQDAVGVHVNNSPALALCADISNRHKHRVLHDDPKITDDAWLDHISLVGAQGLVLVEVRIDAGNSQWDALELANECVDEWTKYLSGAGLPVP